MNKYIFGDVNGLDLREIAPYILEIVYQYRKSTLNDNMVWRISIAGNFNEEHEEHEKQGFKDIIWEHYDHYPMARLAEITQVLSNVNQKLTNSKLNKGKF